METLLVKQVFNEQKSNSQNGDWVKDVENYLRKQKIRLTHEEKTSMSKYMFKNLVRKKCEENG